MERTELTPLTQELMSPDEAAAWFRRSISWLRRQQDLLRLHADNQPLYHVRVCRAYLLGRLAGLSGRELKLVQFHALAAACRLDAERVPELFDQQAINVAIRTRRGSASVAGVQHIECGA